MNFSHPFSLNEKNTEKVFFPKERNFFLIHNIQY